MSIARFARTLRYEQRRRRALRAIRAARGKPVLVYTIGKTGSSTVIATLQRSLPGRPVYQIHHLQPHRIERSEASYRAMPRPVVTGHVVASQYFSRERPASSEDPWDVVTLVREPVAQDVSVFFQVGERRGLFRIDDDERLVDPPTIDELAARFETWRDHTDDATWFEHDFEPSLGIDVFSRPFDHGLGFATYANDRARVLLLRNEDLRRTGPQALGDFFGVPPMALVDANVGDEKRYAAVYAAFRARGVSTALVNVLHGTKLAAHFYTPDELERARARWVPAAR